MILKRTFLICTLLVFGVSVKSQTSLGIQQIITSMDTLRNRIPAEKLYIQLDKPYYLTGDTIRMKAYLFEAALLKGSEKSGIVYVELANDSNKVLFRRMLPVEYGFGAGNIVLDKETMQEGSYTLRAYTNLMRNFGEDLVFKKDFYVSSYYSNSWLVTTQTTASKQEGKDNLRLNLQFSKLNEQTLALQELDIRILDGQKTLQHDRRRTSANGNLDVNFNVPDKTAGDNLLLVATDPRDASRKVTIPIPVNREENIDLQFMPEGGNLVAGIAAVVGFKAIGEDGRGKPISGKIYKTGSSSGKELIANGEEVAVFNSSYRGMGSFEFTPTVGTSYIAKVDLNGTTKSFAMPAVKNAGTVMRLETAVDSIVLTLSNLNPVSNSSAGAAAGTYYLIAQSRGMTCYGALIRFNAHNTVVKKIAKDLFPTGITRFTLLGDDQRPLNERIIFIDHRDNLVATVKPSQEYYKTRDSIAVAIEVKDQAGNPVQGSFSMAITDDRQLKIDSLANNILTSLLLTSDLKGTIEDPVHYFQDSARAKKDLDQLMLTQGWTGYNWKDVFNPPKASYKAEEEFTVTGRVSNLFNKGISDAQVHFLSLRPPEKRTVYTDKDGLFRFGGLPIVDSLQFFINAKNRNQKNSNVGVVVDKFIPPVFSAAVNRINPWYLNSDTTMLRQLNTQIAREGLPTSVNGNLLETVTISGKKIIRNSKNLNGPGKSDQALNENDLLLSSGKTLLDVMTEKIKGFRIGIWPNGNPPSTGLIIAPPFARTMGYLIYNKEVHLVIDGVDVDRFYSPNIPEITGNYVIDRNRAQYKDRMFYIEGFLKSITADQLKGVEIMFDPKYNSSYKSEYAWKYNMSLSVATTDFAFVEVTTRLGNGAFSKPTPGTVLYTPMPYVTAPTFYRPKYLTKANPLIDRRSTIHWEPYILTGQDGKAQVSFYAADLPGTYSIILEGSDMNGNIGRQTGSITIR